MILELGNRAMRPHVMWSHGPTTSNHDAPSLCSVCLCDIPHRRSAGDFSCTKHARAGRRRITRLGVPIPGVPPITDDRQLPPPKHVYLSMERIVAETGGEMTKRREREDFLGEMFARIRSRYLLGFYADTETGGAMFHRLTVRLSPARQRDDPRALVRAPTGHYAAH